MLRASWAGVWETGLEKGPGELGSLVGGGVKGLAVDMVRIRAAAVEDEADEDARESGAGVGEVSARIGVGLTSESEGGVDESVDMGEPRWRGVSKDESCELEGGVADCGRSDEAMLAALASAWCADEGVIEREGGAEKTAAAWVLSTDTSS